MVRLTKDQKGFSPIETVMALVIVVLIAAVGYLVYQNQHKKVGPGNPVTSSNKPTGHVAGPTEQRYYLDNKHVSYALPSDWEVANPDKNTAPPCGDAVTSNLPECTSNATLVLKKEGYVNTDHFYATISVFPISDNTSSSDFFNQTGENGLSGNGTDLTINGISAYRYAATPDPNSSDIWLYYALAKGQVGVLVYCDLFSGNHYSFNTQNNYLLYQNEVDAIAKSIEIN